MRLHLAFRTEMGKSKDNTDLTRGIQCRNIKFHNRDSGFYKGTCLSFHSASVSVILSVIIRFLSCAWFCSCGFTIKLNFCFLL